MKATYFFGYRWDPPVSDYECGYTYCPLPPPNITNAVMTSWFNTLSGYEFNYVTPVVEAKAEILCDVGFHVFHSFR